ncbi:hypothetical protein CGCF415_v015741 [Colletotrichum fructicola]|nr:hypothetical protein CGCF415_v015741 [Colletotrichum fructicola]
MDQQPLAPFRPYRFSNQAKPAIEEHPITTETSILECNQIDCHAITFFYALSAPLTTG